MKLPTKKELEKLSLEGIRRQREHVNRCILKYQKIIAKELRKAALNNEFSITVVVDEKYSESIITELIGWIHTKSTFEAEQSHIFREKKMLAIRITWNL